MNNKKIIIKCPKCGCEYLPGEIFIPESLLGHPTNIIRTENGAIEYYNGDDLNLNEEYICDKCGCHFTINGHVDFKTQEIKEDDWEDSTSISLK